MATSLVSQWTPKLTCGLRRTPTSHEGRVAYGYIDNPPGHRTCQGCSPMWPDDLLDPTEINRAFTGALKVVFDLIIDPIP